MNEAEMCHVGFDSEGNVKKSATKVLAFAQ